MDCIRRHGEKAVMITVLWLCVVHLNCLPPAEASAISFEASVNKKTVARGESIRLELIFRGTQDVAAPELPSLDNVRIRYIGPSREFSIVNGRTTSSVTHLYSLTPEREGMLTIPSLSLDIDGTTYTSEEIPVRVTGAASALPAPRSDSGAAAADNRLYLTMLIPAQDLYINERVPLTIRFYNNELTVRDIEYPELSHEGFAMSEFSKPHHYTTTKDGVRYSVVEFKASLYPLATGTRTLGPARLNCSLIVAQDRPSRSPLFDRDFFQSDIFDDFFNRYERRPLTLTGEKKTVKVLPLPDDNVPDSFYGAVGNFEVSARLTPQKVTEGDPLTLTLTVRGDGNFKTVTAPPLEYGDSFKVYDPDVRVGTQEKIFEYVLIPRNDALNAVPETSWSYFNPVTGRYNRISLGPFPVKVAPRDTPFNDSRPHTLPRKDIRDENIRDTQDIVYIKKNPGVLCPAGRPPFLHPFAWFLIAAPLAAVFAASLYKRARDRDAADPQIRRARHARRVALRRIADLKKRASSAGDVDFYDTAHDILRNFLGDMYRIPQGGITRDSVNDPRMSRFLDKEHAQKIRDFFITCDTVRYGPGTVTEKYAGKRNVLDALETLIRTARKGAQ